MKSFFLVSAILAGCSGGTRSQTTGNCTWTVDGVIDGTLNGDVLTGRLEYTGNGNSNSDCAAISGCVSYQDFNGTRPPR